MLVARFCFHLSFELELERCRLLEGDAEVLAANIDGAVAASLPAVESRVTKLERAARRVPAHKVRSCAIFCVCV